jgi:hypothetical protein
MRQGCLTFVRDAHSRFVGELADGGAGPTVIIFARQTFAARPEDRDIQNMGDGKETDPMGVTADGRN